MRKAAIAVIRVHRFDGSEFVINADLIETVEATPDTVITLNTGRKIVVRDSLNEVVFGVVAYKRAIMLGPSELSAGAGTDRCIS